MKYELPLSNMMRREIERVGIITPVARMGRPTLHWCPDWDFALVHNDGGMEFRACTCAGYHRL